ncbi:unnamed protein product [Dovyalis caffra]|uniref:FHA domain-containing protein n=1 Tax=Dovyalis caffra TaxID=77055 RepID=A0AAV1R511_9ROSI|nr:unnamed protein product [Dovyalis caffra]
MRRLLSCPSLEEFLVKDCDKSVLFFDDDGDDVFGGGELLPSSRLHSLHIIRCAKVRTKRKGVGVGKGAQSDYQFPQSFSFAKLIITDSFIISVNCRLKRRSTDYSSFLYRGEGVSCISIVFSIFGYALEQEPERACTILKKGEGFKDDKGKILMLAEEAGQIPKKPKNQDTGFENEEINELLLSFAEAGVTMNQQTGLILNRDEETMQTPYRCLALNFASKELANCCKRQVSRRHCAVYTNFQEIQKLLLSFSEAELLLGRYMNFFLSPAEVGAAVVRHKGVDLLVRLEGYNMMPTAEHFYLLKTSDHQMRKDCRFSRTKMPFMISCVILAGDLTNDGLELKLGLGNGDGDIEYEFFHSVSRF